MVPCRAIFAVDQGNIERLLTVRGRIHGMRLLAQTFGDEIGNSRIVFHQENAHE